MEIRPFHHGVEPGIITDLHRRLSQTRWPEQLPGIVGWSRGVPVAAAQEFAHHWLNLDWGLVEAELNRIPQFSVTIDAQHVHFIHVTSARQDAQPLLALHGWPGTIMELIDLIEPLTAPEDLSAPAFHVVIPSHPGIGLSGPTTEPSWGVGRTAQAYATLMAGLGYDSYWVQGGDHGAVIAPHLGRIDAEHVRGIHLNAATIGFIPMGPVGPETASAMSDSDRHRLALITQFMTDGNGYNVIQATRPQTIGFGLEDSPAALLTWMLEKFHEWSGDPALLEDEHVRGRILSNVMLYWLTRTATSAANNVYAEYGSLFADPQAFVNSGVPTAVAVFPTDPSIRQFAEQANTVVRWREFARGGHFAALEAPAELIGDLRAFVTEQGNSGDKMA